MAFYTRNATSDTSLTERLRIMAVPTSQGTVLNILSSDYAGSSTSDIRFTYNPSFQYQNSISNLFDGGTAANNQMIFKICDSSVSGLNPVLVLKGDTTVVIPGYLGIGTSPSYPLQVNGTSYLIGTIYNSANVATGLRDADTGSHAFCFDGTSKQCRIVGNLGAGKDPSYAVDVSGDVNVTGHFKVGGTNLAYGDVGAEPSFGHGTIATKNETVSTSAASGTPADGDIWLQYTP